MALIFISERPGVQFRGFLSIFQPQIGTVVPFLTEFSTDITEVVVTSGHSWTSLDMVVHEWTKIPITHYYPYLYAKVVILSNNAVRMQAELLIISILHHFYTVWFGKNLYI